MTQTISQAVSDQAQRKQALDISKSFIVQAPAGSGKTELLTQRYLALLAHVERAPEQIIAITFTRKAAHEMRYRVINKLTQAQKTAQPEAPEALLTWRLAKAVIARDSKAGWGLLDNHHRLAIMTIDSYCASITRSKPILSRFGHQPAIIDDATPLYQRAAQAVLASIDSEAHWADAAASVLTCLDNHFERAVNLIAKLLARREQWLAMVVNARCDADSREILETQLNDCVTDLVAAVDDHLPAHWRAELVQLAAFASAHAPSDSAMTVAKTLDDFPARTSTAVRYWQAIVSLLITQSGSVRKAINKNLGFPAPSTARNAQDKALFASNKKRLSAILNECAALDEGHGLLIACKALQDAPPVTYNDRQWQFLSSLLQLLPIACAQLRVLFQQTGQVDFSEVAQGAIQALGDEGQPSDLMLSVDDRIQHILVDEFQDTSMAQWTLLERLTSGWQMHDGRTLFLVGDPMQSIYRFRQAQVSLFLRAREAGIGHIRCHSLLLTSNFRAAPHLIDWINTACTQYFPRRDNATLDAIAYSPAVAGNVQQSDGGVHIHACHDGLAEAAQVVRIVQSECQDKPTRQCAILVRSRRHLVHILPALIQSGVPYQALEIDALTSRAVVQDCYALTRALLQLADRIAWLAILRAPWCGLSLADILVLAEDNETSLIWQAMQAPECIARLSRQGAKRIQRCVDVIRTSLRLRDRQPLHEWVAGTWLALGGPAGYDDAHCLTDAEQYFQMLAALQQEGDPHPDVSTLRRRLDQLLAKETTHTAAQVQVMTIHKAKGLEFDCVIIPGLDKRAKGDDSPLLAWLTRPTKMGEMAVLMAPLQPDCRQTDRLYRYICGQTQQKALHELTRLLYVALSRARSTIHLLACSKQSGDKPYQPGLGSFLALLWPMLQAHFASPVAESDPVQQPSCDKKAISVFKRLSDTWCYPIDVAVFANPSAELTVGDDNPIDPAHYVWRADLERPIGILVHRILCQIGQEGLAQWDAGRVRAMTAHWAVQCLQLGVIHNQCQVASRRVLDAILHTISDERGRWILSHAHSHGACEQGISTIVDQQQIIRSVVDVTFVLHGRRWIIDYKMGSNSKEQLKAYRQQLQAYARAYSQFEQKPITLALYFPLSGEWLCWPAKQPGRSSDLTTGSKKACCQARTPPQ